MDDQPELVTVEDSPPAPPPVQDATQHLEVSNEVIEDILSSVDLTDFPDLPDLPDLLEDTTHLWSVLPFSNSLLADSQSTNYIPDSVENTHFTVPYPSDSVSSNGPLVTLTNVPITNLECNDLYFVPDPMFGMCGDTY